MNGMIGRSGTLIEASGLTVIFLPSRRHDDVLVLHSALLRSALQSGSAWLELASSVEPLSAVMDECARRDRLRHIVEIAGADFALMLGGRVADPSAANSSCCSFT